MENKKTVENYTEDRRDEITAQTSALYHSMLENGQYKDLLVKFGQNGKYSLNNVLFMLTQNPDMTVAKSMNEWTRYGRHIVKDGQNMEVMAPTRTAAPKENEADESGEGEAKTKRASEFHPMYVFDISQTEGDEYKPFAITKDITDEQKKTLLDGVYRALSVKRYKCKFADESEFGEKEYYAIDKDKKLIKLRKRMNNQTTALAAVTAASKAICDSYKNENFSGLTGTEAERLESLSRGCILAAHFGSDTKPYDFSSVAEMDEEKREAFRNNLGIVCAGTKLVMDRISTAFYKAQQARETASAPEEEIVGEPFRPDKSKKSEMEVA
ncbi:MAG: hypothetical protein IJV87_01360 [Clostridia bacterium]|nr:hypothetical protein [Clostridia bacterium]